MDEDADIYTGWGTEEAGIRGGWGNKEVLADGRGFEEAALSCGWENEEVVFLVDPGMRRLGVYGGWMDDETSNLGKWGSEEVVSVVRWMLRSLIEDK